MKVPVATLAWRLEEEAAGGREYEDEKASQKWRSSRDQMRLIC